MSNFEITVAIIWCIFFVIPILIGIFLFCYGAASKFVEEDNKDKSGLNPIVIILAILLFLGVIYALSSNDCGEPAGMFRP